MLLCIWIPLDLCQVTVRNYLSTSKFIQNCIGICPLYEAILKEVEYVFSCTEREKSSHKQQTQHPLMFLRDVVYTDPSPSQVHFMTTSTHCESKFLTEGEDAHMHSPVTSSHNAPSPSLGTGGLGEGWGGCSFGWGSGGLSLITQILS